MKFRQFVVGQFGQLEFRQLAFIDAKPDDNLFVNGAGRSSPAKTKAARKRDYPMWCITERRLGFQLHCPRQKKRPAGGVRGPLAHPLAGFYFSDVIRYS